MTVGPAQMAQVVVPQWKIPYIAAPSATISLRAYATMISCHLTVWLFLWDAISLLFDPLTEYQ